MRQGWRAGDQLAWRDGTSSTVQSLFNHVFININTFLLKAIYVQALTKTRATPCSQGMCSLAQETGSAEIKMQTAGPPGRAAKRVTVIGPGERYGGGWEERSEHVLSRNCVCRNTCKDTKITDKVQNL